MATPFVQGRLLGRKLKGTITSVCARCDEAIEVDIDSELRTRVTRGAAEPLVSTPMVNWSKLEDPSIIDVF